MKLLVERIKGGYSLYIEGKNGKKTLARDYIQLELERQGLNRTRLEYMAGLDPGQGHLFYTGKSNSLGIALSLLEALGYELFMLKTDILEP